MRLHKLFKKKNIDSEKIKTSVMKKNIAKKSALFVIGALLSALAFNLFCVPNNFVTGGLGGIAIILNEEFNINATMIILIGNLIFITISIFTLGFKQSLLSILGASVSTVFVYATQSIPNLINFSFDDTLLYVLAAGAVGGFGDALVYKAGFTTGGTSIIAQVIAYYSKQSLGKILRYISYLIIIFGGITFGYTAIMYSLIITIISSALVDKILIGISESKTLFIQTDKTEEVTDFIIKIIENGVTEFTTRGAYSHKRNTMLMCVVPTEKYTLLMSAIKEIDSDAFVVVSDCYEVLGGTERKKLSLD